LKNQKVVGWKKGGQSARVTKEEGGGDYGEEDLERKTKKSSLKGEGGQRSRSSIEKKGSMDSRAYCTEETNGLAASQGKKSDRLTIGRELQTKEEEKRRIKRKSGISAGLGVGKGRRALVRLAKEKSAGGKSLVRGGEEVKGNGIEGRGFIRMHDENEFC